MSMFTPICSKLVKLKQQINWLKSRIKELDKIQKLFSTGYPVITLARHLDRYETVEDLQALNWFGIDIVPRPFRHYPEGQLAAHLLGYVNVDSHGQGGVEQGLEQKLKDTGELVTPQLDGHGSLIPIVLSKSNKPSINPPLGRYIELTIDNYLQHLAEKELFAMCKHANAQRGAAIITDPKNGEILAWANYPSFDPNQYSKYPFEVTKNWSMVDVYQPGSTFKILTVASALDLGSITPSSTFYDAGSLIVRQSHCP